mmetsp:Transcript_32472/g.78826  ORF Transcript_32472/g.78826 Transcript_32472/m.78826 type:complete len:654 (+) Transcript_32472:62-2023(+)
MASLYTQEAQEGEAGPVEQTNASDAPPFPSLRALDFDLADLWCHSLLEQPIEGNVEALFEELEKIIPRLTPLNISDDDDEDMPQSSNDDDAAAKAKKTEQTVGIRMRMLEVWQDVLTLQFEEDETEGSETQTSTPSAQLVFPDPGGTAEAISTIRNRLRLLFEKLKAEKGQNNDDDYHCLRRSLLAVEDVLDFEATLTSITNKSSPPAPSKGASATKSPATTNEWLDQLSEMLKNLSQTFLDDNVPVPGALASVARFVLQLVTDRQTESPPSPSPLTQDSAITDHHDDNDEVSDEDIAKVQQGLHNLYGRPESPFYIAQLQEDARQLLLNWSTQDLEIPKLIQLGYLTGKKITTSTGTDSANTSFDTAVQGAGVDVEVQTESSVQPANDVATNQAKEGVARRPQNGSDSETALEDILRKKVQGRPSKVADQIWGNSKKRRNADTNSSIIAPGYMDDEDDGGGKQRATARKQKRHDTSQTKRKDPPAPTAATSAASGRTSPSKLKPPPQYPSQPKPTPSSRNSKKPTSLQVSSKAEDENSRKRRATGSNQVAHRRASDPTKKTRTDVQKKSPSSKRSRSQEPVVVTKNQVARKKQKKNSKMPTEADILEAISRGIGTYGYGNWTMIQKRSGGILKQLTGSQIKEKAESLTALTV